MKTKHKAKLEAVLEKFINEIADDDAADGYYYDELHNDMAVAATAVFDASMRAQLFAKEQQ